VGIQVVVEKVAMRVEPSDTNSEWCSVVWFVVMCDDDG
jgi:hypothetical protein